MSIQVTCSNGHVLQVRDDMAGKAGLCPACKTVVRVPQPLRSMDFEDSICDMLNAPCRSSEESGSADNLTDPSSQSVRYFGAMKECYKCHGEIAAASHICPLCHTYIAQLSDF